MKRLSAALVGLSLLIVLACGAPSATPVPTSTTDIQATVDAAVKAALPTQTATPIPNRAAHCGRCRSGYHTGHTDGHGCSNADAHNDTSSYSNSNSNACSYAHAKSNACSYAHAKSNACSYAHAKSNTSPHSYVNSNTYGDGHVFSHLSICNTTNQAQRGTY